MSISFLRLAAPPLDGEDGNQREEHIGNTRNHDVEENIAHRITRRLEDLLRIVEDYIRAAPLLEHCNHDAQEQYLVERLREEGRKACLLLCIGIGCCW